MSTEFQGKARDLLLPPKAVAEVLVMARDHMIDLNSVNLTVGMNGNAAILRVGEIRTSNFILVTMSPIMVTVARYVKKGCKTIPAETKSF